MAAAFALTDFDPELGVDVMASMLLKANLFQNIDLYLRTAMNDIIPDNIHELGRNRLYITVTQVHPKLITKPIIINSFSSKSQLIQCLGASCFIPVYSSRKYFTTQIDDFIPEKYIYDREYLQRNVKDGQKEEINEKKKKWD